MSFYAVANGRTIGIFLSWVECSESIKGYKKAIYKKFDTRESAQQFIDDYQKSVVSVPIEKKDCEGELFEPDYFVYTDGACSNNGRKNAMAGIGVFFGVDDTRNISRRIEGKQTNNTAELSAIGAVYSVLENDILLGKKIGIVSDSEYAIRCVGSYGAKCALKKWAVDIPNQDLVRRIHEMYHDKPNIRFIHVDAHTGKTDTHSLGNDHADKLANMSVGII